MRSMFIYFLLISFIHSQAFGVSYLTGDAIRSPDRSKTWLMPDASDTLVGKETEDTLKNKTLENPEIEGALTVEELSAKPTPPPAGQKKIYCKDDGKCYTLDSSDNEKRIGAGAGGGSDGINFLTNPTFEDGSLDGWTTVSGLDYEVDEDEALGPNVTTICVNWEGLPNAVISQIADISADALGFSNVDGVNLGHKIWVKASFEGLKVEAMHLVGAGPATVANALDIPGDFKWREFDVTSVGSAMLTGVGIRIRPTNSNTGKVCFAAAKVGPWDGVGTVSAIKETQRFTPTLIGVTASSVEAFWWRVGDRMHVSGRITLSGPATGSIGIRIPAGYTVDNEKISSTASPTELPAVGFARASDVTPSTNYSGIAIYGGSNEIFFIGPNNSPRWSAAVPFTWESGDSFSFKFDVPIVGWSADEGAFRVGQGADLLGAIIYVESATCPAGTLKADGSTIPSEYSALIARRGSSTLPDLRGIFIRGAGSQTIGSKTYSATLGEKQNDATAVNGLSAIQAPHHHHEGMGTDPGNKRYGDTVLPAQNVFVGMQNFIGSYTHHANTSTAQPAITVNSSDSETRPANIALTPCMIASHTYQPLVKHAVTTPYPGVTTINTVKTVSSNYSLTDKDETVEVNASGGAVTITLPDAATFKGKKFFVTKTDSSANLVTIATTGGQNIGYGTATSTVIHLQGDTVGLQSNGTRWVWITSNMRVESALIECDSTPVVQFQTGSWISSVSQVSTGRCNITVRSGVFSFTPRCNFSVANGGAPNHFVSQGHGVSATSINATVWNITSASGTDGLVNVTCEGPR